MLTIQRDLERVNVVLEVILKEKALLLMDSRIMDRRRNNNVDADDDDDDDDDDVDDDVAKIIIMIAFLIDSLLSYDNQSILVHTHTHCFIQEGRKQEQLAFWRRVESGEVSDDCNDTFPNA